MKSLSALLSATMAAHKEDLMSTKTFTGTSSGPKASIDEALSNALTGAQGALNTNHFSWKLHQVTGDYGGIVGKNITIEIEAS